MNDKDKEAFEKWCNLNVYVHTFDEFIYEGWQASCEYKDKEIESCKRYKDLLVEQLESCSKENENWQKLYNEVNDELKEWREAARSEADEVNRLQAENKKLREALEFYANCTRLMLDVRDLPKDPVLGYSIVSSKSIMDNGDVAREALKKVGRE